MNNNNNGFGGIEVNQMRPIQNTIYNVPDLNSRKRELEEVQRRTNEMAKSMIDEEEKRRIDKDKSQKAIDKCGDNYKKRVIRRKKIIIAVAIIAAAIGSGILLAKVVPKIDFSSLANETTQHEVTLDELKATLDAGYTEVQIDGHWYVTKDAIESMEQSIPLDSSKSLDVKVSENVEENKIR